MVLTELQSLAGIPFLSYFSGHDDRVWSLAWSPKGDLLATSSSDKKIIIWAATGPDGSFVQKVSSDTHVIHVEIASAVRYA